MLFAFVAGLAIAHEPGVLGPGLTAPVLIERVVPVYPEAARQAGIGGVVGLEIEISKTGTVTSVKVVHPAGFGLDDSAVEAAWQFKFKPATRNGEPIEATVLFDQQFVLRPHLSSETSAEEPAREAPAEVEVPLASTATRAVPYESTVVARGPTSAASASSIRNLDFDLRPKTSPNDVLRVVPGLLAVQHQGGGKADQLFLRGFDADHGTDVGVFIDGIPVNMPSHAHGQGFADLHWLIPEALERVDVVKGPYDVRYGDFSTAGAVNLITRERFESSSVQYTLGTLAVSGREVAQGRFVGIASPDLGEDSKLHPWVAFEAAYDNGPFAVSEDLKRYNLFSKLSYDLTPRLKIGTFIQAYGSGWTGSGQIPAREVDAGRLDQFGAIDPTEGGLTERQMITGFAKYRNGDDELTATIYLTRYRLSLWNDFTFFLQDPVNGDEIEQDDQRMITGGRVQYDWSRTLGGVSLRTTLGSEMRYDAIHVDRWNATSQNGDYRKRLSRRIDTSDQALNGSDVDIDQENVAGYFNEDVVFNEYFRLLGGLRADFFGMNVSDRGETLGPGNQNSSGTRQFTAFSPKASAVFSPLPEVLDLYLNAGQGFHTNMAQIALIDGRTLKDPTGAQFTVRARPYLKGGEIGARAHLFERLDLATALWISDLQNETVFDADNAVFSPGPPTRRYGVDLEARARLLPWLYADLDLAQAHAEARPNGGNGGAVALAPKFYMTGGLSVKHPDGIRAGLRFRYLGPRPAFDEASDEYKAFNATDPSRVNTQGYLIFDAYAALRKELDNALFRAVEASVSIQNLLNSTWREAQFGNHSCTRDEVTNPSNPNFGVCGATLPSASRTGVVDVHYTPGIPLNLQFTLKALFD